jgi:hypothetical protein
MTNLNFFRTKPETPDQLANPVVPWMMTPVDQYTFRTTSENVQLWTVTTTTEKYSPPNPEPRLDPSQVSSTEEHNPKRNETKTIGPEYHHGSDLNEYDSPSDDDDLHFKAQMHHLPEIGEANAESTERTKRIQDEVAQIKKQRQWHRENRRTHTLQTRVTPTNQQALLPATYEDFPANPEPYRTHPMWDLLPPIEYYFNK